MSNDNIIPLRVLPDQPTRTSKSTQIPSDLVDEIVLSERLGVARSTLQSWRYSKRGPRYLKIGRLIRYRNADVENFLRDSAQCG